MRGCGATRAHGERAQSGCDTYDRLAQSVGHCPYMPVCDELCAPTSCGCWVVSRRRGAEKTFRRLSQSERPRCAVSGTWTGYRTVTARAAGRLATPGWRLESGVIV
eukprot:454131-Prymnesium_polylepis.2